LTLPNRFAIRLTDGLPESRPWLTDRPSALTKASQQIGASVKVAAAWDVSLAAACFRS
jgi:hypothetical protein